MAYNKKELKAFVSRWKGKGYEKGDTQQFWLQALRAIGYSGLDEVIFEHHLPSGGFIDVWIPDADVLIEQKGIDIDLDKPEQRQGQLKTPLVQALDYAEELPIPQQPRYIITCNFQTFRVYDRGHFSKSQLASNAFEFSLEEFGEHPEHLGFINDPGNSRLEKEKRVSIQAGELIGKLYDKIRTCYIEPDSEESMHSLNVLCVRLVFCLYCEDSDLFEKNGFYNYLKPVPANGIRNALKRLFKALDTKIEDRDPYDLDIKHFPYVNGGLFREETEIPNFTDEMKSFLLEKVSSPVDWSQISPTIFGGIFESTLNPETRRKGGMHYTSPENIHKVIDPLFLDDLKAEFVSIRDEVGATPRKRKNALRKFHQKLCSLKFFDPACGSGNFLTETYICLRKLENSVLRELEQGQAKLGFGDEDVVGDRVNLGQFYGIEINDFAVTVAETALWISRLKANGESEMILSLEGNDFPLNESAHIVHGNALRINWNNVLPAEECSFIIGNPPFLGHISRSAEQSEELRQVWNRSDIGRLDYVTGWYKKTVDYAQNRNNIEWAFVSTNSISMGEPVPTLFEYVFSKGWRIKYAHRTFIWNNEASDIAHVHVVIIGFTKSSTQAQLFSYTRTQSEPIITKVDNINGYLLNAPNVFINQRREVLFPVLNPVTMGNMPRGKGLIVEADEVTLFLNDPVAKKYLRKFLMGRELINNEERYCLWMENLNPEDLEKSVLLKQRIEDVRNFRLKSKAKSTYDMAQMPHLFGQRSFIPVTTYLGIPKVFSGIRSYAICDLLSPDVIPGDKVYVCDDPDGFQFAMISSSFFINWQKAIGGRLKSDCSFSNTIVWNNFPVLNFDEANRQSIIDAGKNILLARSNHKGDSLAEMYDGISLMPENPSKIEKRKYAQHKYDDLLAAHKELDKAVEAAYGVDFNGDEEKIVAHLFKLYSEKIAE